MPKTNQLCREQPTGAITALVTLLAENATIVISGARIAREIGVSRSTVWRWVERLRELGVRAKEPSAHGLLSGESPDLLAPAC